MPRAIHGETLRIVRAKLTGLTRRAQVLAAVTRSPGEMVVDDVPEPGAAGRGQVVVRPEMVGICGSDVHLYSGGIGALSGARDFYPRIQGHELCAIVEDVGGECPPGIYAGDRVAIWPLLSCGRCYPCRAGRVNACVRLELVGVHLDGAVGIHTQEQAPVHRHHEQPSVG